MSEGQINPNVDLDETVKLNSVYLEDLLTAHSRKQADHRLALWSLHVLNANTPYVELGK